MGNTKLAIVPALLTLGVCEKLKWCQHEWLFVRLGHVLHVCRQALATMNI